MVDIVPKHVDLKQHLGLAPLIGVQHGIYASSFKNRNIALNFTLKAMFDFCLSGCCASPGNRPFTLRPTLGSLPLRALSKFEFHFRHLNQSKSKTKVEIDDILKTFPQS